MLSDAKVATPATAATDAVPPSVPPSGLVPIASVTLPANPVATFPNASRAVTSTAGVMVAAAAVLVGCTVNTSRDAAAGVMLKVALVTPRSPSAEKLSVYPVPTLSIDKSERSEEHTSELQSPCNLVCRLLLEKKKKMRI